MSATRSIIAAPAADQSGAEGSDAAMGTESYQGSDDGSERSFTLKVLFGLARHCLPSFF